MNLKPKKPQAPSDPPASKPDKWTGPWGRINPTSTGFDVVRFCQRPDRTPEQTHSYPYRVISSWHWIDRFPEELKIEAGSDLVTVKGRGLDRIMEALDCGTLEILCETPSEEGAIWVSAITVVGMPTPSH
jgi:hypothetical protein